MRQWLHRIVVAVGRLSRREQILVATLAGLAAVAGLYLFVIEPIVDWRARMQQRIETLSRDLPSLEALAGKVRRLEAELGAVADVQASTGTDFSLFAFIDKAAAASIARDAIAAMNPSRRPMRDGFEENSVELRLNSVSLVELVGLLRRIEDAEQPVYVKRLEIKRRYDDATRFDATIVAGALSRT